MHAETRAGLNERLAAGRPIDPNSDGFKAIVGLAGDAIEKLTAVDDVGIDLFLSPMGRRIGDPNDFERIVADHFGVVVERTSDISV